MARMCELVYLVDLYLVLLALVEGLGLMVKQVGELVRPSVAAPSHSNTSRRLLSSRGWSSGMTSQTGMFSCGIT